MAENSYQNNSPSQVDFIDLTKNPLYIPTNKMRQKIK
jgi:hypothetical protein